MEPQYIVIALFASLLTNKTEGTYIQRIYGSSKRSTLMQRFINDCKEDKACQRIIIIKQETGECEQSTREQW